MFASNQKITITGDLGHCNDLEDALRFVLHKDHGDGCNPKYKYPNAFYISEDGRYVLGQTYGEQRKGWTLYPFETSIEILAPIIRQHLLNQKFPPGYEGDGDESKGYLITCEHPEYQSTDHHYELYDRWSAIITFEPFTCYYAK